MKKHEILSECTRLFPKGTTAKFKGCITNHTSTGVFKITDLNGDGSVQVMADNGMDCFYENGEFAIPMENGNPKEITLFGEDGNCKVTIRNNGSIAIDDIKVGRSNIGVNFPKEDAQLIIETYNKLNNE